MSNQIFGDNSPQIQTVVLFDHDGTTCLTNENAYSSIQFAVREVAKILNLDISLIESSWDQIFHETRGTTELYFLKVIFNKISTQKNTLEEFSKLYYSARANWYKNMKSYSQYTYDTYYPDAEELIFFCWKTPNIHLGIVTGNPEETMKERLATHLSEIFLTPNSINTYGNEASTREDLIKLAIEKAKNTIPGFKLNINKNIATNVIYIGDSRADLFAGITAEVKTIWIPSRSLQNQKDAISEDSIVLLRKLLPNAIYVTNSLESDNVKEFILKN